MVKLPMPDASAKRGKLAESAQGAPRAGDRPAASLAEQLLYPPGFQPPPATASEARSSRPPETTDVVVRGDRYPPGHPKADSATAASERTSTGGRSTGGRTPQAPVDADAKPASEPPPTVQSVSPDAQASPEDLLPPVASIGVEAPPLAEHGVALESLLPPSAEPSTFEPPAAASYLPPAPADAAPTAGIAATLARELAAERRRRKLIGNLLVWGVCTVLLCLTLWLLLSR